MVMAMIVPFVFILIEVLKKTSVEEREQSVEMESVQDENMELPKMHKISATPDLRENKKMAALKAFLTRKVISLEEVNEGVLSEGINRSIW